MSSLAFYGKVAGGVALAGGVAYVVYGYSQRLKAAEAAVEKAHGEKEAETPREYVCPITRELMNCPVFTADGHTYERRAILGWLRNHDKSPLTGKKLGDRLIRPNHSLRAQILDYRVRAGLPELPPWEPEDTEEPEADATDHQEQQLQQLQEQQLQQLQQQLPPHLQGMMNGLPGQPPRMPTQLPEHEREMLTRAVNFLIASAPQVVAVLEMQLSIPAGKTKQSTDVVVSSIMSKPAVWAWCVSIVQRMPEMQNAFLVAIYWDGQRFNVPGNPHGSVPPYVHAVRRGDIAEVERYTNSGAFDPHLPAAGFLMMESVWGLEPERMAALLLSRGVSVDATNPQGYTLLMLGSVHGSVPLVKLAIDKGADVNKRSVGGGTALHQAAYAGNVKVVTMLLDAGANALAPKDDALTPLLFACLRGHLAVALTLVERGGLDSVFMNDVSGMSPVTAAAISGNKDLVEWLLGNGAVISGTTQDGSKPIHHAVQCNSVEVAKFLLDSGAALDETRSDGDTLLHIAAKRGSMEMATDLLARGCNPRIHNREQFTPLHAAIWQKHEEVAKLFVEAGVDLESQASNNSTALHFAAWHGMTELLKYLLEKGAKVSSRTRDGDTALHQAVFGNKTRSVMHLLDTHADDLIPPAIPLPSAPLEKYIDSQKADGCTPLHLGAAADHVEMLDILLAAGAKTDIKNRSGLTALQVAQSQGRSNAMLRLQRE